MLNLVVDIGNSFFKLAIFDNRTIQRHTQVDQLDKDVVEEFIGSTVLDNSIVSSVKSEVADLESLLAEKSKYIRFTASTQSRLINRYKTPHTLGLDRYAAVIGATELFPGTNCLVIDAGSCITYDFVDEGRNYFGGSISPGINMRFKAMNHFTARLPLVEPKAGQDQPYGDDTQSSILSGVQRGVLYEATGFIQYYCSKYADLKVLLCGGDVKFFEQQLKNTIFAHIFEATPHLVLIGLNEVIHHHND